MAGYILLILFALLQIWSIRKTVILFSIFFFFNASNLCSQGYGLSDSTIQVMTTQFKSAENDTLKLDISWRLARHYIQNQRDSATLYFHEAYLSSKALNYPVATAYSSSYVGYTHLLSGDFKSAYQWTNLSRNYSEQIDVNETSSLFPIINTGNMFASKLESYYGVKSQNARLISFIYSEIGMKEEALLYLREGLDHIERTNNRPYTAMAHSNLGRGYFGVDSLGKAEIHHHKANELFPDSHIWKGENLRLLAKIEFKKANNARALEYIQESIPYDEANNNRGGLAEAYHMLGDYYYAEKEYDQAIREYDRSDELYRKSDAGYLGFDSMLSRAKCYLAKGDIVKAHEFTVRGQSLKDDSNADLQTRITEFHKFILDENNDLRLDQVRVSKERSQRRTIGFSVLAGLLSLIGVILWRNNQQKQKSNEVLSQTLDNLKATQTQLIQSEKMASLGELTAGIAHEIQNPLNFVNNFSEVSGELAMELKEELNNGEIAEAKEISDSLIQNLEKISHHGDRASSIVKGMLAHSRTGSGEKELTDLNALCDEYMRLSYHGMHAKDKSFNADFELDLDPALPLIQAVPQDLGRVILNMINNAFFTCAERSRSKVDQKRKSEPDADYKPNVTLATQAVNDVIKIIVKDNGQGMSKETLDKIFQPFFTTKPTGQGTGLGMSISYDIVTKGHGGALEVESEEGVGSTFVITLPKEVMRKEA